MAAGINNSLSPVSVLILTPGGKQSRSVYCQELNKQIEQPVLLQITICHVHAGAKCNHHSTCSTIIGANRRRKL